MLISVDQQVNNCICRQVNNCICNIWLNILIYGYLLDIPAIPAYQCICVMVELMFYWLYC